DVSDEAAARHTAALAEREVAERETAERETAERDAAAREVAQRVAAEREAEIRAAAEREAAEREVAEREIAERAAAERAAPETAATQQVAAERVHAERSAVDEAAREPAAAEPAAEHAAEQREVAEHQLHTALPVLDLNTPQHASHEGHAPASFESAQPNADTLTAAQSGTTSEPLPAAHHENLDGATTAASLAAAGELGADALPLTSLEPVDETFQQEVPPHRLQWDDEPAPIAATEPLAQQDTTHVEPTHQPFDESQPHPESHQQADTATPDGASEFEPAPIAQTHPALSVPTEFPRDAVDAFSSLDMPLPPRVESTDTAVSPLASLSTQPVASPETIAQQAVAPHDPDDAPHIADEISAGTAGHAAVAGLGAVGFGALKLDFDLELPPSPAQPLPAFTQADLTRIARNKLDLAAEYIDLGDLSGARVLINEVIEANDPATRTEARALLSTLAPLS
ncbi:FimV/HubP family polar landmark protein, partial [Paraburkholderia elongata]